jgi:hypothetical protein
LLAWWSELTNGEDLCLRAGRFGNDETKLVDAVNRMEYVPTYEDKDGDWMLGGDVPWK